MDDKKAIIIRMVRNKGSYLGVSGTGGISYHNRDIKVILDVEGDVQGIPILCQGSNNFGAMLLKEIVKERDGWQHPRTWNPITAQKRGCLIGGCFMEVSESYIL